MAQYQTLLVDKNEGVTTITLNRPEKRNAMSPQLHRDMYDCLTELRYDKDTRVIVITGAGESFCAGPGFEAIFHRNGFAAGARAGRSARKISPMAQRDTA